MWTFALQRHFHRNLCDDDNGVPSKIIPKNDYENTGLQLLIAGIIFSAAIGNIFLARKMRLVMKSAKVSGHKPESSHSGQNQHSANSSGWKRSEQFKSEHIFDLQRSNELFKYLQVLGLPATPNPRREDVKKAYRNTCLLCHPDRTKDESVKKERVKLFQEVNTAYTYILSHIDAKSPPSAS